MAEDRPFCKEVRSKLVFNKLKHADRLGSIYEPGINFIQASKSAKNHDYNRPLSVEHCLWVVFFFLILLTMQNIEVVV